MQQASIPQDAYRSHTYGLFDVLEMLPVDVVERNLMPHSWNRRERACFRQVCGQALRLTDLLTSEMDLTHGAGDHAVQPSMDQQLECWLQEAAQRSVCLGRLQRLTSLNLRVKGSESAVLSLLSHYGSATQGRLTRLMLRDATLSAATMSAICQACPKLQQLDLISCSGFASLPEDALQPKDLLPLLDLPLTEVSST